MEFLILLFMAIVIAMVIRALVLGPRNPSKQRNHNTPNGTDNIYYGSDITHHCNHHEYSDHNSGFDFSSGDSGSCDSGGCDGGGGGCD
ncbi:MAG: hypothetical protein APF81_07570 [Desulfosporosinus sp. BRH_c37]|nr:MAG: hypothetical protein APF81_07570 [Desulfosporosinus sp. BRH_c37]